MAAAYLLSLPWIPVRSNLALVASSSVIASLIPILSPGASAEHATPILVKETKLSNISLSLFG
ncbi:hypothetical protein QQP08_004293 [Theobroma cacao]|nr:hypothetical protein QQP08_004293 [Theobroma cacao]